ncbi:MAG: hypothetical protein RR775_00480 [Massilia sp.]|uniref:hypothetical protein n=1 Tax=Massilia sp. TaxID=1882437 RepID=UPI002FC8029F
MKNSLVLTLFAAMTLPVHAQPVVQAVTAQLQPQISRDADGYTACGIRAIVIDMQPKVVEAYDFSLYLRAGMPAGTIKAGKHQTISAKFSNGRFDRKVVVPGPENFWIAQELEGKALIPLKVFAGDAPGYVLGLTDLAGTHAAIASMMAGQRMQFAVRYKNQPYDTVVSFASELPSKELTPLAACMDGLVARMKRDAAMPGD